jgi:transcriptional regulator with XRE-family HTH domain
MNTAVTIRNCRRAAGLTQTELARRSGTSQPTLSAYERGTVTPSVETLVRLLDACGCSLEVATNRHRETVEQRKSRAIRAAIIGRIAADAAGSIARARRNLETMRAADSEGHGARVLERWAGLLDGPVEEIVEVMLAADRFSPGVTNDRVDNEQLASSNPFAGLLSPKERWNVLRRFRSEEDARAA